MKSEREECRSLCSRAIAELPIGGSVTIVGEVVHKAFGTPHWDKIGRGGTTIRPWASLRTDLRIEPDAASDLVKVTRLAYTHPAAKP